MKHYYIMLAATAALLLSACSDNEGGTSATDGISPITFTTGSMTTRATVDGAWDGGEDVAINMRGDVRHYRVGEDAATLAGIDDANTFWWVSPTECIKHLKAWYLSSGYTTTEPTVVSVPKDQSKTMPDFLYVPPVTIAYSNDDIELNFRHQLARVNIIITSTLPVDITSISFGTAKSPLSTSGTFTPPQGDLTPEGQTQTIFGAWTPATSDSPIIPKQLTTDNDTTYSFTAVIMPQNRPDTLLTITLRNGTRLHYIDKAVETFVSGVSYTYRLHYDNTLHILVDAAAWKAGTLGGPTVDAVLWGTGSSLGTTTGDDPWIPGLSGSTASGDSWKKGDNTGTTGSETKWDGKETSGSTAQGSPWVNNGACGSTTSAGNWSQGGKGGSSSGTGNWSQGSTQGGTGGSTTDWTDDNDGKTETIEVVE